MTSLLCNLDIVSLEGEILVQAENMQYHRFTDQLDGWLRQGLEVRVRKSPDDLSPNSDDSGHSGVDVTPNA